MIIDITSREWRDMALLSKFFNAIVGVIKNNIVTVDGVALVIAKRRMIEFTRALVIDNEKSYQVN